MNHMEMEVIFQLKLKSGNLCFKLQTIHLFYSQDSLNLHHIKEEKRLQKGAQEELKPLKRPSIGKEHHRPCSCKLKRSSKLEPIQMVLTTLSKWLCSLRLNVLIVFNAQDFANHIISYVSDLMAELIH